MFSYTYVFKASTCISFVELNAKHRPENLFDGIEALPVMFVSMLVFSNTGVLMLCKVVVNKSDKAWVVVQLPIIVALSVVESDIFMNGPEMISVIDDSDVIVVMVIFSAISKIRRVESKKAENKTERLINICCKMLTDSNLYIIYFP